MKTKLATTTSMLIVLMTMGNVADARQNIPADDDTRVYPSKDGSTGVMFYEDVPMKRKALRTALLTPGAAECKGISHDDDQRYNTPIRRVVPKMPKKAVKSGHCNLIFDVTPAGRPINVKTTDCTDDVFEFPARATVARWLYEPLIVDGAPVMRCGLVSRMTYTLRDHKGAIIPE